MEIPYEIRFGKYPDPNVIAVSSTRVNVWDDVYTWRCPALMNLVLRPGDVVSARLFAAGVEIGAPDALVMIEARDARNRVISRVFGPSNYLSITEFSDVKSRARFRLPTEIILTPKTLLVVMVKNNVAMTSVDITDLNFGIIKTHRRGG